MEQSKSPKLVKQLLIVNADMIHGIFTQLCSPIQNPSCHELNVGNQLSWKQQYILMAMPFISIHIKKIQ